MSEGGKPHDLMKNLVSVVCLLGAMAINLNGCATPRDGGEVVTLRVMSYNIRHGEGMDGRVDLERIAEVIRSSGADIVALQEVDRGVERTEGRDLTAELAVLTGMHGVFSNNFNFEGGEYGNAVLTRFPVADSTNRHYEMIREGEQRGLLQVRLQVGTRELLLWNTHLDYRPDDVERWSSAGEILEELARSKELPVVLCGDLNDVPESRTLTRLKDRFMDAWESAGTGESRTHSSTIPSKRIDYILIRRGSGIRVLKAWTIDSRASDHRPVVADLEWR